MRSFTRYGLLLVGAGFALQGCVHDVVAPTQTVWETNLMSSLEYPDVSGTAAAVSANGGTQASVRVEGLPNGSYRWGVYRGTCAEPGSLLGETETYPGLSGGPSGSSTADAAFTVFMNARGAFLAQVLNSTGTRVACGDFEPWS